MAGGLTERASSAWLLLLLALIWPQAARSAVTFFDATTLAGVDYVQQTIDLQTVVGPEFMTGGAAAADYDGDGWIDLYVTRFDDHDLLFRNQGDGTFVDESFSAGLQAHVLKSNAAIFADVDNDGDPDLFVSTHQDTRYHLFINDGLGAFTEEAVARGAAVSGPDAHFGFGVGVGDYDRDGYVDIYVTEWRTDVFNPTLAASNSRLLRNLGAANPGHFEDRTAAAGVGLDPVPLLFGQMGTTAFAPAIVDVDGDGWPDIAIANDFGSTRIFWNDGDGTFTDGSASAGVVGDGAGGAGDENGMGSTLADYDGDGRLDWFVTAIYDPADTCQCNNGLTGNRLYRNEGNRTFSDQTDAVGVRDGAWGWGAAFLDFDNDGDLDLTMNNGQTFLGLSGGNEENYANDPVRLWRNDGGVMSEVASSLGVVAQGSGKGVLSFDYDRDGDLDLFYTTALGHPHLYRNDGGNDNDWLRVDVVGSTSTREGLGTRVVIVPTPGADPRVAVIGSVSHFLGQSESTAHFGLGASSPPVTSVRVEFPSGQIAELQNVAVNQVLSVNEPQSVLCNDGFDNDGDGLVDFPDDPGCDDALDTSERSAALPCDDGIDGDGDGWTDHRPDQDSDGIGEFPGDPACHSPSALREDAKCQNGVNDDQLFGMDFDGGASVNGGVPLGSADPDCTGKPWRNREGSPGCGLGAELVLILLPLQALRRRRRP
ncbi:MAG: CRTAC1 family protein [Myxococcota bacterium]|nr:CRTAC1 family protein [Myxococcota bacterium]